MYINFQAPYGTGGELGPVVPQFVADAAGNPLPLQPAIPAAIPIPGVTLAAAASSASSPIVYPWVDYGLPLSVVSGDARSQRAGFDAGVLGWNGYVGNSAPPWSDAVQGRSPCCGGRGGFLDRLKQHPWVTLGVVLALALAVKGASE